MAEEVRIKHRRLYFFAFLFAWIGMYFVAYYAVGYNDTVVEGIIVGLVFTCTLALAAIISVCLGMFIRWIFEKTGDKTKHYITAIFSNDGRAAHAVTGELVGKAAKAKIKETIKNNNLTNDMLLVLRGVESRVNVQIQSEGRALKALDKLNAAYKDCKDAGTSPPDELRKSAIDFWGVVDASHNLHQMTVHVCSEIEKTLALQRVMDLPPYPDLYADAIGEDISPLLDAVKERRENLQAAWNEVEDALKTYDVP